MTIDMQETYRPKLHFTPAKGWMNDPNGLIRKDGLWHLFFQHDPDSITHGPMHWGHAVSRDLVDWEQRPVALRPDTLGTCFSGSAVQGPDGVRLFYTAHSLTKEGRDFQVQCMARADDAMSVFRTDPGNPILCNPGREVFRDPKVIWHEGTARWVMLLTEGQSIAFYASDDMTRWEYLTSFGTCHGQHGRGVWECPDLLELPFEDGMKWVLIVSISEDAPGGGSGTQYFVGQFDGRRFTNDHAPDQVLWLDMGRDFYAPQSFFDPGGAPVLMAWASNWSYARQTPTRAFRGAASLPRELSLTRTPDGVRLAQKVPETVTRAFALRRDRGTFCHRFVLDRNGARDVSIALFGEAAPHYRLTRLPGGCVRVTATRAEGHDLPGFAHEVTTELLWPEDQPLSVELYVDRGMVELLLADGTVSLTNLHFPAMPEGPLTLTHHPHTRTPGAPHPIAKGGQNG
ncbi:glycoside hydrolase family 32 protein [Salipiger mangrovisoli]|uniref:Glycoside hydrolase family 32 protein n=1 Tax=Salipiger mangrovisoli TaxID=2865933 RepID=A0ABR9XB49_9RHOB|nr:glycoside hydrolase family 32 protein [Salipiger mangrovisoli]MBE9640849.1 glycoside hydrolase family 32 protein [Salipiger mangrovisoli]